MKKFIKVFGIIILVLFIILLVTPIFFKGKILDVAKKTMNESMNAKVDFSDLSISLIRNFPNASVRLKNLYIAGIGDFENETLLKLKAFDVKVDMVSAIKMENIKIKGILLDNPVINALVREDGKVNWDIMKTDTTEIEEVDTTESEFTTKIAIKKFEIRNAYINYIDDSSKMSASLGDFDFLMRGDFSQEQTDLDINSTTSRVNFIMDGMKYVKDASLKMDISLGADLKNSIYTLKENTISLNDLALMFNGRFEMPNDSDIIVDMNFATKNNEFKSLLSLVPAVYMKDFQDVKTSGKLSLEGAVNGLYSGEKMPNAKLNLRVENAMFKYPDLPKSADNIQIDVDVFYDGTIMDSTTVDLNRFHIEFGGNPVDLVMNIKTPESDMHLNGLFNINLDLSTLADVVPLDSMTLKGKIKGAIDFMGYMSSIEKEEYEDFKANGNLTVSDFVYNSPDLPNAFLINNALMNFSPKFVEVANFDAEIGNSDMQFSGRVENFIPYVFKDKTIRGNFLFTSGVLDINEFITESTEEETVAEDTSALSVVEVPSNIDFRLESRIGKIYYDKLEISNTLGIITVRDSKVMMENLSMNMLQGSLKLNGEYNTQDIKAPLVDFGIDAQSIDIPSAVNSFSVIESLAPVAKSASGKINLNMQYTSLLDQQMSPVLNSIVGKGSFSSDNIGLEKSKMFSKIGDALKTKAFDNLALENVNVNFEINNGRIIIEPFETKMGQSNFVIGGSQGIDQTMSYALNINTPKSNLGSGATDAINNLYAQAASKGLNFQQSDQIGIGVNVGGTVTDPQISLNLKDNVKQGVQAVKEEIKEKVKEEINAKKEEVKEKVSEEAQKIMAQARNEAEAIKKQAADAANTVRKEANANADKLVNEAKNPVSKKAAELTAKKMRQEGDDKAKLIEKEADEKANKIISEAQVRADKLSQ